MAGMKKKVKRATKRFWPLVLAAAVVLLLLAAWTAVPADEWIHAIGARVAELGWVGPFVYFVLYILGTVMLAPSPLMSIAAGVAFGWWGFPLAVAAATAGATASFLIGRHLLNDDLEDFLTDRRAFRTAKHAIDEEGWRIQILLRLSPVVPFGLLNYLLGLTRTSFGTYVCSTAIGILPGSFVDIYIGVIGQGLAGGAEIAYLVAGSMVTVSCAVLITWKARNCLREAGVKT
jgi:uncharacterized membrane protein YdjX (TVP38/TMEM64 family)